MAKAIWKDTVIAESNSTETVEGNVYFPPESLKREYLVDSAQQSTCPWKGVANYYSITVGGDTNRDAGWYYPDPKPEAANIKDYVAFWRGVVIES